MQQRWIAVVLVLALAGLSWAVAVWPTPETELAAAPQPERQPAPLPPWAAGAVSPSPVPGAPSQSASEPPIAEPAAAPSVSAAAQAQADDPPLFEHDQGPVAEYKARFASEPRDSAASDAELLVRDAFKLTDSPNPVFRSVLCRKTVCKLEVRLAADQLGAYVAGMGRLTQHFDQHLAVTRTAEHAGEVSLEVYAQRLPQAE